MADQVTRPFRYCDPCLGSGVDTKTTPASFCKTCGGSGKIMLDPPEQPKIVKLECK